MRCTRKKFRFHRSASGRDSKDLSLRRTTPQLSLDQNSFYCSRSSRFVYEIIIVVLEYKKACHLLSFKRRQAVHLRGTTLVAPLHPWRNPRNPSIASYRWLTVAVYYPVAKPVRKMNIRYFHCSASRRVAGSFDCVAPSRSSLISRIPTAPVHCVTTYPFGI